MDIYDAAIRYEKEGTPLVVFAGQEYGTGSSRDWAAKGTLLLGVKAVIAGAVLLARNHEQRRPLRLVTGGDVEDAPRLAGPCARRERTGAR